VQFSLDLEDLVSNGEPIIVKVRPDQEAPGAKADLIAVDTGQKVASASLRADPEWQTVDFGVQPLGAYRVTVSGAGAMTPVSDIFEVA
jgi:hypothetical protein